MKNRTKNYTIALFLLLFMLSTRVSAQITPIPDEGFEQLLIDEEIDSDGIVNGQVLTSDINSVQELIIMSSYGVESLAGIEDFTQLETLEIYEPFIESIDISNNINLKTFWAIKNLPNNQQMVLEYIDFSNNINLESIAIINISTLRYLDVSNGNNDDLNLSINCYFFEKPCFFNISCIIVDDAEAANNGEGSYGSWNIGGGTYEYTENCEELGITNINYTTIKLYPNPVGDQLMMQSNTPLEKANIYSVTGALVKEVPVKADTSINVQDLTQGLYFVRLEDEKGRLLTKKFVKQ